MNNRAKRIVLIYPPIINQISNINISAFDKNIGCYPPLGLLSIATYLKKNTSFEVTIVDCFAEKMDFGQIRQRLKALSPDMIGISAMTHFWLDVLEIARIAKAVLADVKVIVGGPHATIYPVTSVKNKDIDFTVSGEGEIAFAKLAQAFADGRVEEEISEIPGVVSKLHVQAGKIDPDFQGQRIDDLNSIPFPDHSLLDNSKYYSVFAKKGSFTTMMTSRGCPFSCIFCDRLGKNFRPVSAKRVVAEMKECSAVGVNNFFFHDDTFTVDKDRVKEICRLIGEQHLSVSWEARSRVDCVDYELLKVMKASGLRRISFGVESGNQDVLNKLRKGIRIETVREVFAACRQLDIKTLADFMVGSPGETLKELSDTLRLVKAIRPDYVQFSITCPYPGTPLYEQLLKQGSLKEDVWLKFAESPDKQFSPPVASEYFTRGQLERLAVYSYRKTYFNLPFLFKELMKVRSLEMLFSRLKVAASLSKFQTGEKVMRQGGIR